MLIVIGLEDILAPPFAGLRYTLAFLCLLPFALHGGLVTKLRRLSAEMAARLLPLGLLYYAVTQGIQFLNLAYLPATTINLLLSFATVLVALLDILSLEKRPATMQWAGTGLLAGVAAYFYRLVLSRSEGIGLLVAGTSVGANALFSVLGQDVSRRDELDSMVVTVVSLIALLAWLFLGQPLGWRR